MASNIDSGCFLGVQASRNTVLETSGTRHGLLWEAICESKIVPNPSWKRFQDAIDLEEWFGSVAERLDTNFRVFFQDSA